MRHLIAIGACAAAAAPCCASILDLTSAMSSGVINGARFETVDFPGAGTGIFGPFVRIQANGTEQGYNTSGRPVPFDELTAANFTHDLQLNQIPTRVISGTSYYEFWLDINQNNGNSLLSLDKIQLYTSAIGSQNTTNVSSLGVLRYDLDLGGDNWIKMDYALASGSGQGDIRMYVPVSFFSGALGTDFLYLYSRYGDNLASNDGFEEWAIRTVPGPGAGVVLGLGCVVAARRRRR